MAGKLFKSRTVEEQASSLASFMPGGRPFLAARIDGTKLRALLLGLAQELYRADNSLNDITYEHQIDQTTYLIEEWESALGIPGACIPVADTLAERRTNVLLKLKAHGVQTAQDFIDLMGFLGYTITITPGADIGLFALPFPARFFDRPQTARFTMFVNIITLEFPNVFPLDFPIAFANNIFAMLECLLDKLRPANVQLSIAYELPNADAFITESGKAYINAENGLIIKKE